jgi:peptide/nickel transport system ATP-binding protein
MLLAVADLSIDLATPGGPLRVVDGVSFGVEEGESLGVVGESGSGKTMTALALMGLSPEGARISGSIRFEERELIGLDDDAMRPLRGDRIAMIFQEPMTALNPLHRIGDQVAEPLRLHRGLARAAALAEATRQLERVALLDPQRAARAYPFQLSGGERQRAMIAMAIACRPKLIIADEPTTALDVTVQAQILALLERLRADFGMAMLLVSHDLAVIAGHCDRVIVMYAGSVMESGPAEAVLRQAAHPYTRALIEARPQAGGPRGARLKTIPGGPPDRAGARGACPFAARCPLVIDICRAAPPPVVAIGADRRSRCFRVDSNGRLPADSSPP